MSTDNTKTQFKVAMEASQIISNACNTKEEAKDILQTVAELIDMEWAKIQI